MLQILFALGAKKIIFTEKIIGLIQTFEKK